MPESGQISENFDRIVGVIQTDLMARYFMKGKKIILVTPINFCYSTYFHSHHHLCKDRKHSAVSEYMAISLCMRGDFNLPNQGLSTCTFNTVYMFIGLQDL